MAKQTDAVALEVFSNALLSISEEMGALLIRTAYSTNIKERHDASTAIFDAEGRLIAQAEHIPMHLGALLSAITYILKRYPKKTLRPGDAFLANDPYNGGGTHLADVTVASPVFVGSPGDIPVPADYDGDGATDFAVWTPATATWRIRRSAPRSTRKACASRR